MNDSNNFGQSRNIDNKQQARELIDQIFISDDEQYNHDIDIPFLKPVEFDLPLDLNLNLPKNDSLVRDQVKTEYIQSNPDVLTTNTALLESLGEIYKRNDEFTLFINHSQVDQKYLCYDDSMNPQKIIPHSTAQIDSQQNQNDQFYGIYQKPREKQQMNKDFMNGMKRKDLYQNNIVNLINNYYSDKYQDLDQKRIIAEQEYQRALNNKYSSIEYENYFKLKLDNEDDFDRLNNFDNEDPEQTLVQKKESQKLSEQNAQNKLNIDSLFNDIINKKDEFAPIQNQKEIQSVSNNGTNVNFRNNISNLQINSNRSNVQAGNEVHQNMNSFSNFALESPLVRQEQKFSPLPVHEPPGPQVEYDQVEIEYYQDVFQYWDEIVEQQEKMETRSNTFINEMDLTAQQGYDQTQNQKRSNYHEDSEMSDDEATNKSLKPENSDCKVLNGIYREGEDFLKNQCSETDRQMIRCFPNITDPEHTELLLDIFARRRHLESIAKSVDKVAQKHRELIRLERQNQPRPEAKIKELKDDILKEEQKMWTTHREFCQTRKYQAREFSQAFKNVYHTSSQAIRDLKKQIIEANRRNSQNKQIHVFNDSEVAFMRWYVSIFGDNWRLISNVLNYHPFTRGYLWSKESLQEQFIYYINAATRSTLLNDAIPLKPWRTTGLPILITERPPSLYCSIKQINQMHHTKIKSLDILRTNPNKQKVLKLYYDMAFDTPKLKIKFLGWKKKMNGQISRYHCFDKSQVGQKRQRDDSIDEVEADKNMNQEINYLFFEISNDDESYIQNSYLGQQIDQILSNDQLSQPRPNFDFFSCHNRRVEFSKLHPSNQKYQNQQRQRAVQFEEQKHQQFSRLATGGKGGKIIPATIALNNTQIQNTQEQKQKIEVSNEELNTPMFCALHETKNSNSSKSVYAKSVSHQAGITFWLGYLYKKIAQSRCEQKVRIINDQGLEEHKRFEKNLHQQILSQHLREAKRVRIQAEQQAKLPDRRILSREEQKEITRNNTIMQELAFYQMDYSLGLATGQGSRRDASGRAQWDTLEGKEYVQDIWDDHESIFYFDPDPDKLQQYLDIDRANVGGERKLDSIIDTMDTKWDRMDRYWFQKNSHLDQKMRKKKDSPAYYQSHRQSFSSSNSLLRPPGTGNIAIGELISGQETAANSTNAMQSPNADQSNFQNLNAMQFQHN